MPLAHENVGIAQRDLITPLDTNGQEILPDRKVVLMSIGMSNASQEWCHLKHGGANNSECNDWSFIGQTMGQGLDPNLVIVNGAAGGQSMEKWDCLPIDCAGDTFPDYAVDGNYERVDSVLTASGLSAEQVQVVWVKGLVAHSYCRDSMAGDSTALLPNGPACGNAVYPNMVDAIAAETVLGDVMRELKRHYPNLRMAFVSSRIYGGWNNTRYDPVDNDPRISHSPEPYAFETGFAVKRLIDAQVRQLAGGPVDQEAGNLCINGVPPCVTSLESAPWVAWGPYLWDDEITWDFDHASALIAWDGTHPSPKYKDRPPSPINSYCDIDCGEKRVGAILLDFFKTSQFTAPWFL